MEIKINRDGTEFGPYTLEQVNELLADGSLLPDPRDVANTAATDSFDPEAG